MQSDWDALIRDSEKLSMLVRQNAKNNTDEFPKEILFNSHSMSGVMQTLRKNTKCIRDKNKIGRKQVPHAPIPLMGEKGVGKTQIVQYIHSSLECSGHLVQINAASFDNKNLFESELFGYKKGGHSTAFGSKEGTIDKANNGTLFIDEIQEISGLETKLNTFIETGTFYRVGCVELRKVDLVLVVASNNLNESLMKLKSDFLDRLGYNYPFRRILIPPLRNRKDELLSWIDFFVRKESYHFDVSDPNVLKWFERRIIQKLFVYDWPGNLRELRCWVEALFEHVYYCGEKEFSRKLTTNKLPDDLCVWENQYYSTNVTPPSSTKIPNTPEDLHAILEKEKGQFKHRRDLSKKYGWNDNTLGKKLKQFGINWRAFLAP